jgi:hypothetical protein
MANDSDKEKIARLADEITEHVEVILASANVGSSGKLTYVAADVVSIDRILTVSAYVMRDLARVNKDQKDSTSVAKFVGYIGFWFSKIKPINVVKKCTIDKNGVPVDREIQDINERVALVLMDRALLRLASASDLSISTVWDECDIHDCKLDNKSKNGLCFFKKNSLFKSKFGYRFSDYLVYTMRFRAGSPYLMVNYIEQSIFFSCEKACPPMFAK